MTAAQNDTQSRRITQQREHFGQSLALIKT